MNLNLGLLYLRPVHPDGVSNEYITEAVKRGATILEQTDNSVSIQWRKGLVKTYKIRTKYSLHRGNYAEQD